MMEKVIKQCRKPTGKFGKFITKRMNSGHAGVASWGLTHVSVNTDDIILDIGCGGGRNINNFANMAVEGKVHGID